VGVPTLGVNGSKTICSWDGEAVALSMLNGWSNTPDPRVLVTWSSLIFVSPVLVAVGLNSSLASRPRMLGGDGSFAVVDGLLVAPFFLDRFFLTSENPPESVVLELVDGDSPMVLQ
jgi:hypothetical protein